jgi:hypothetical protein
MGFLDLFVGSVSSICLLYCLWVFFISRVDTVFMGGGGPGQLSLTARHQLSVQYIRLGGGGGGWEGG